MAKVRSNGTESNGTSPMSGKNLVLELFWLKLSANRSIFQIWISQEPFDRLGWFFVWWCNTIRGIHWWCYFPWGHAQTCPVMPDFAQFCPFVQFCPILPLGVWGSRRGAVNMEVTLNERQNGFLSWYSTFGVTKVVISSYRPWVLTKNALNESD